MQYEKIPDQKDRLCVDCSTEDARYDPIYTQQKPVGVEYHSGPRESYSKRASIHWVWECLECGEEQL